MKIKRQKKVMRILNFFKHNYGHHPPYQLLLDGTFTQACLQMKVNIREQLPKYLNAETKILTTQCCIQEIEKLGSALSGATSILKQFPIHQCGHDKEPKPAAKCLKSMLKDTNPTRYFIMSQDAELRDKARKVPGTPVLFLYQSAPTLERPSEMSTKTAEDSTTDKIEHSFQSRVLEELKKKEFGDPNSLKRPLKRKKKGPNPLSCLKSKKKRADGAAPASTESRPHAAGQSQSKKKRARHRKKTQTGTTPS
ncbi:hypothetical protein TCAL_14298 [Tigriopus californicus]|uniref:rRNA-processing protein UTP23 homolog n=1 Tax=Tigriopus californicus TaxID=6832 RepID=A0A553NER3_TIGCA|nr:rRNA-processing protein UTP23 homolog [Tigriopus californicus]TRY63921.1 hypothetical protein TCAL_14298 [Tigriopus californicus]